MYWVCIKVNPLERSKRSPTSWAKIEHFNVRMTPLQDALSIHEGKRVQFVRGTDTKGVHYQSSKGCSSKGGTERSCLTTTIEIHP